METLAVLAVMGLIMYGVYYFGATNGNDALQDAQVMNYLSDGKMHYVYGDLDTYSGVKHPWIWVVLDRLETKGIVFSERETGKEEGKNRYMYGLKK